MPGHLTPGGFYAPISAASLQMVVCGIISRCNDIIYRFILMEMTITKILHACKMARYSGSWCTTMRLSAVYRHDKVHVGIKAHSNNR